MNRYRFSIITVCYNEENSIKETMQSVIDQTYKNYEYIIIDGCSTDTTVKIIGSTIGQLNNIRFFTEPDKGIYDAMNKGINLAQGEYFLFLNSGDKLVNKFVLEHVDRFIQKNKSDIYFGNVIQRLTNGKEVYRVYNKFCSKKIYFLSGDVICHQAVFAASYTLKERGFNISLKVCADKEWMLYQIEQGRKFAPMKFAVSYVLEEGFSLKHIEVFEDETLYCLNQYCNKFLWIYYIICWMKQNEKIKYVIRRLGKFLFIRRKNENGI